MAAIFGIVGDCTEAELACMGQRLAHKGSSIETWSPANNVHLGEVRYWPRQPGEDPNTASAVHLDLDWAAIGLDDCASAPLRDAVRRNRLARELQNDPIRAASALDGLFAFAHWEANNNQLILAVDRSGYERIYYAKTADRLAFASDYKALLALPDVMIKPNVDALQFAVSTSMINVEMTLASGIRRVPQAHQVRIAGDVEQCDAYWRARSTPRRISLRAAAEEVREVMTGQIRRSLAPFDRLALTLSGGLDSSGLLGLIRATHPEKPVSTYTIGYADDDPEIVGARESADYFNTDHHELVFDPASIPEDLPQLIWLAEELAGREEAILQYQIESHLLRRENVVVAGHGADMVYCGMPRHRLVRMAEKIPLAKRGLTELFQQTQSGASPGSVTGRLASWMLYRGKNIVPPRLQGSTAAAKVFEPPSLDDFNTHTICEMPEFHFHSATHALAPVEPILPFQSNAVIEHALTVPAHLKTTMRRQKIVLREALAPHLPEAIRNRGKAIQRVRHDRALTEVLDVMADELLSDSAMANRGLVDPKYVSRLRTRGGQDSYSGDQLSRLWMLLISEIWCRTFVDERGAAPLKLSVR